MTSVDLRGARDAPSDRADAAEAGPLGTPSRRRFKVSGDWLFFVVLVTIIGGVILPPLVVMVWKSFVPGAVSLDGPLSAKAYRDVFGSNEFLRTLKFTTIFVVLSTLLAMVLATAIAWLVVRTNAAGRSLAYFGMFLGIATPGIVSSIGWLLMLGGDGGFLNKQLAEAGLPTFNVSTLTGMVLVEAFRLTPMAFLFIIGPLRSMNTSLEEAGLMSGASSLTVLRRITAPVMLPALIGSALLCLVWAIQAFEVPLVLGSAAGIPIFTAELYSSLRNSMFPDYAITAEYGVIMVVGLALLIWAENRVLRHGRRYQVVTGKDQAAPTRDLGRWRWAAAAFFGLFAAVNLLPVVYTIVASVSPRVGSPFDLTSVTMRNYQALLDYRGFEAAIRNSLLIAVVTAVITVALAFAASWYLTRRQSTARSRIVEQLASTPLVIPTVVLSLGVLLFYLYTPIPLYGTLGIVLMAYIAHYIPYGVRYLKPALMSVSTELEEAARTSGASETQVARRVVFPLVRPAALGVGTYVFSLAFRELSLAVLLVTAGTPMLSTMLLGAIGHGDLNVVGAMGTVMMLISLVVSGLAYRFLGGMGQRTGE